MARSALIASFVTLSGAGFGEPARFSVAERARAAAAAGFTGIGLHVNDLVDLSAAEASRILADHGLVLGEIEFLAGWVNPQDGHDVEATMAAAIELAHLAGGHHLSTGDFSGIALDLPASATRLAELAGRAAAVGLRLAIESFAWSALNTVASTDALVDEVGAANVGHLLDVWHFFNTGATLDTIAALRPGRIAAVQLNDGPRVHGDFLSNARNTRWLPGDGELDVRGFVAALRAWGWDGPWGVEVSYPEYRGLGLQEAAGRAHAACRRILSDD